MGRIGRVRSHSMDPTLNHIAFTADAKKSIYARTRAHTHTDIQQTKIKPLQHTAYSILTYVLTNSLVGCMSSRSDGRPSHDNSRSFSCGIFWTDGER